MARTPLFSIRKYVTRRFLWGVLLAVGLVVLQVGLISRDYALDELELESGQQLNLYIASLRGQLEKYEFLPEMLATNSRLLQLLKDPGDRERIVALNRYLETVNNIADASDTYLMDRDGLTIAASNWQSERPFIGRNFSYRPYFKEAMKGNLGRYFALGTTSNRRGYYFAYPVRQGEEILGAVVMKVTLNDFESSWKRNSWEFIVTDPDGVIFSTTKPEWRFQTMTHLKTHVINRIKESRRYQDAALTPLPARFDKTHTGKTIIEIYSPQSVKYLLMDKEMPQAGWKVHILARLDPVYMQTWRSVLFAAVLFVSLLLVYLFLQQRRRRLLDQARYERTVKRTLEANEAKIRAILENTQAGVLLLDMAHTIEFANSKAHQLIGYSAGDMTGVALLDCIEASERDRIKKIFQRSDHTVVTLETTAVTVGGSSLPVELSLGELRLGGAAKHIATLHDISHRIAQEAALLEAQYELESRVEERTEDLTMSNIRLMREIEEHRTTEQALRDTQGQLIQAAKLAALGQMATGISHELNQPLAAIRSYADNARALMQNQRLEDAHWNLLQISELTERMAKISAQLKVFSRKTTGKLVNVSLVGALENSLQILRPRINETNTEVILNLPDTELYVRADMVQLEQVLINVVGNAIQAMEESSERLIRINAWREYEVILVEISDSGPGMEAQEIAHIFEPFFTTKEEGRGLGLGLSISQRIIESMSGEITAENHTEGGAVFTIQLRAVESPEKKQVIG